MNNIAKLYSQPEVVEIAFDELLNAYNTLMDTSTKFQEDMINALQPNIFNYYGMLSQNNIVETMLSLAEKYGHYIREYSELKTFSEVTRYDFDLFQLRLVESLNLLVDTAGQHFDLTFQNYSFVIDKAFITFDDYATVLPLLLSAVKEMTKFISQLLTNY
jgi:hypothetical protein